MGGAILAGYGSADPDNEARIALFDKSEEVCVKTSRTFSQDDHLQQRQGALQQLGCCDPGSKASGDRRRAFRNRGSMYQ